MSDPRGGRAEGRIDDAFPRACAYPSTARSDRVCERDRAYATAAHFTERHLQCIWADARLRPTALRTMEGEAVDVEHPGTWNLEAGPDFIGAVLRVGAERRRMTGDVEIHIHPSDWSHHGHAADPRYARVRAHVTWFEGLAHGLPPGAIHIALRERMLADPYFAFEDIDPRAYPAAARAPAPPCREILRLLGPDAQGAFLEAAGEERLRRKAAAMASRIDAVGEGQALYEAWMAALGYRKNTGAFRALARRVPLDRLRASAGGRVVEAYAILLGVAGLLPEEPGDSWDDEARHYLRALWDAWWKHQGGWSEERLERSDWQRSGLRPLNHPVRRLAAAAQLFVAPRPLEEHVKRLALPAHRPLERTLSEACALEGMPFWDRHTSWTSPKSDKQAALIGPDRWKALLINVLTPFWAAVGRERTLIEHVLSHLPCEPSTTILRETAHALFGPDHPSSLYRTGLRMQGLLQIQADFCLNDRSRCATCPLPSFLASSREEPPRHAP